ncbi:hypothetical protein [Geodermatophilus sp. SYSU D00700]
MSLQQGAGGTVDADPKVLALGAFERWSNYLLVTTVAAAGWIASKNLEIRPGWRDAALWCLGLSIVFGILTLALVPLIVQTMAARHTSIYRVPVKFHLFTGEMPRVFLTQACRPQHAFFIAGIACYCIGVSERGNWQTPAIITAAAVVYGLLSFPKDHKDIPDGEDIHKERSETPSVGGAPGESARTESSGAAPA